jgi:hypothetical protein
VRRKRSLRHVPLAVLIVLAASPSAVAATYDVQTCDGEHREVVPNQNWRAIGAPGAVSINTDCSSKPTTFRLSGPDSAPGSAAGLAFSVPSPLAISHATYHGVATAPASLTDGDWWWDLEHRITPVGRASVPVGYCPGRYNYCTNSYVTGIIKDRGLYTSVEWLLRCSQDSRTACSYDGRAGLELFDAKFTVEDPVAPSLEGLPNGSIFGGAPAVAGDQTVAFEASDKGGGVYRAILEVDGVLAAEQIFDRDVPTCRAPFRVAQPCAEKVSGSLLFDTARYVDGPHEARLIVFDATGSNQATYGPISFLTSNRTLESYCSIQDARRFSLRTPHAAVAFGKRFLLRATVSDAADWEALVLEGKRRLAIIASTTIPSTGRLAIRIPKGTNRTLRLAVRPIGSRDKFICSKPRRVEVSAKVSLNAEPSVVRNGGSVTLNGRVRGKRRGQKSVVIQARAIGGRRWATVRVVRTDRRGGYDMRYRFRSTFEPVTYVFRSQVPGERGYPYSKGTSPKRKVHVSPY